MKPFAFHVSSLLFFAGLAGAADEPPLKEGLWSIHTETTSQPGDKKVVGNRQLCRSHAYDESVKERAKAQQGSQCKVIADKSSDGKSESETECLIAGTTVHAKATSITTGDAAVHAETHTTYSPALGGTTEITTIIDSKYVGECPAGVEPGDNIAPDGKVIKPLPLKR